MLCLTVLSYCSGSVTLLIFLAALLLKMVHAAPTVIELVLFPTEAEAGAHILEGQAQF